MEFSFVESELYLICATSVTLVYITRERVGPAISVAFYLLYLRP